jgi:hypothetical protein
MSDSGSKDSSNLRKKKWTLVILIQVALAAGLFNPWSETVSKGAAVVFLLEVLLLVCVSLPVFLYQIFIKKKSFSESFTISIDTILSYLWLGV